MNSVIQTYDIVMLVVLLGATIFGAWKGMIWQIASLASLLLSAWVALHFSAPLAPYFSATEPWNRFLAMLILYILTSLAIWLVFRFISGIVDKIKLKEFDRQMGAMFGLAKGLLLCVVITFFAVTLWESTRQMVLKSYSGYAIASLTHKANPILPDDVRAVIGKYIDELDKKLEPSQTELQGESKSAGKENLENGVRMAEEKLRQAGQNLEELGRRADNKLEDIGRQSQEAIDAQTPQESRGGQ
jgi:membrane protein required for colicin V production